MTIVIFVLHRGHSDPPSLSPQGPHTQLWPHGTSTCVRLVLRHIQHSSPGSNPLLCCLRTGAGFDAAAGFEAAAGGAAAAAGGALGGGAAAVAEALSGQQLKQISSEHSPQYQRLLEPPKCPSLDPALQMLQM